MVNLRSIDPFAVIYIHESYILYTPYHTYWIRIRVRIRFRKM